MTRQISWWTSRGVNVLHLARDSRRFRRRVTIDGLAVIRFPKNTTIINIIIIIIVALTIINIIIIIVVLIIIIIFVGIARRFCTLSALRYMIENLEFRIKVFRTLLYFCITTLPASNIIVVICKLTHRRLDPTRIMFITDFETFTIQSREEAVFLLYETPLQRSPSGG